MRHVAYFLGILLVTGALAYAAIVLLGVPAVWVGLGCVIILGMGLICAASNSSSRRVVTTTSQGVPAPPPGGTQTHVTREEL